MAHQRNLSNANLRPREVEPAQVAFMRSSNESPREPGSKELLEINKKLKKSINSLEEKSEHFGKNDEGKQFPTAQQKFDCLQILYQESRDLDYSLF